MSQNNFNKSDNNNFNETDTNGWHTVLSKQRLNSLLLISNSY